MQFHDIVNVRLDNVEPERTACADPGQQSDIVVDLIRKGKKDFIYV
jgi:hypothetical protein